MALTNDFGDRNALFGRRRKVEEQSSIESRYREPRY